MDLINTFSQPGEPSSFLNFFDISFLIILNILFYFIYLRNRIKLDALQKTTWIVLFLIVIPLVSIKIELINIFKTYPVIDGFNLVYTLLRFPTWWIIAILNFVLLKIILKNINNSQLIEKPY